MNVWKFIYLDEHYKEDYMIVEGVSHTDAFIRLFSSLPKSHSIQSFQLLSKEELIQLNFYERKEKYESKTYQNSNWGKFMFANPATT